MTNLTPATNFGNNALRVDAIDPPYRTDDNVNSSFLPTDRPGLVTATHIQLTTLTGITDSAWQYRLGSRSALEWVLDQHKERKPRDPTIRERFNTYRFADHKERVIDLLQRVCTVSVETVRIVDELAELTDIEPTQDQQSNPHMVTVSQSGPFS